MHAAMAQDMADINSINSLSFFQLQAILAAAGPVILENLTYHNMIHSRPNGCHSRAE